MKRVFGWVLLCVTALFAACGGGDEPLGEGPDVPAVQVTATISGITESYTSASVKVKNTNAESLAYIVSSQSDHSYTAEEVFTSGTTVKCTKNSTTTVTLSELADNSSYTLFVAAKGGEEYSDVVSRGFTTKVLPEYSLVSKACQGFRVVGRLPDTLPAASVVKWAITDLATYNLNGGAQNDDYWLSRNEAIYPNILAKRYELEIKPETRTFTKDGQTYAWYEPILPGQPVVLLLAEYGEGSHSEWGMGHYSPLFGTANPSGYYRKETIITTKPTTFNTKPTVKFDLRPSGKGTISISVTTEITSYNLMILSAEQYNNVLSLLDNNSALLQWFTTSTVAKEKFGSVEIKGNTQIDAQTINLQSDKEYHLLITSHGNTEGTKQSFAEHVFSLPPTAPLATDNTIIAHRGGSKEAGKTNCPDNSIASLKYAMGLGCYASEADIYWTKDNKIIVAHADSNCKVNGLYPWENTLADIQAAGRLSNGEIVPSLEDYIRTVMVKGSKTKLCLDIKSITKPTTHHPESVKACQRACEIIVEMEAQNFCEFICSGYEDIVKYCASYANKVGVPIGAMGKFSASQYKNWGYTWHNRDKGYDISLSKLQSYFDAGMTVSVFTIDTDDEWSSINGHYKQLRGITTNYPNKFMSKFR